MDTPLEMTLPLDSIVSVLSFGSVVVLALLSTRFVTKAEYKEETEQRTKIREKIEERLGALEKFSALAERPISEMASTLKAIDEKMALFLDAQRAHDGRILRIEMERDLRSQLKQENTNAPFTQHDHGRSDKS